MAPVQPDDRNGNGEQLHELFTLTNAPGARARLTLHLRGLEGYELRLDATDGPVRSQVTPGACQIKAIADEWRGDARRGLVLIAKAE